MMDADGASYADWLGEKPPEPPGPKLNSLMPWKE